MSLLTLSQTTNFQTQPNLEFADDNFNYVENSRKLFKQVENTVGKGEIARYEQFLLFRQCFQRLALQTRKNQGLFGKGLIIYLSAIETLVCDREMSLIGSTSFSFAQNMIHNFQNTVLNS